MPIIPLPIFSSSLGSLPSINIEIEPFIVQGCVFQGIPLVQVDDPTIFDHIKNGDMVTVDSGKGEVMITPAIKHVEPMTDQSAS